MTLHRQTISVAFVLACTPAPHAAHVEISPLPTVTTPIDSPHVDEDPACRPGALTPIEPDSSGALDGAEVRRVLEASSEFAKRCCSGDEEEDALVLVTLSPDGYATEVSVTPQSSGPTNACLYATFHRVMAKPFHGDALTVRVPIHITGATNE